MVNRYPRIVMESTKDRVLQIIQARGGATVATIADALDVGQASVRRHLDHLRVEGLADVRTERSGVGRPAFVYYPTEEGEERDPAGYSRLLSRLYTGLSSLDQGQVRGRDGTQVLRQVFQGVAEQVAKEHESEVASESLEDRVAQVSTALHKEGIIDSWTKTPEGYRIVNAACPYRRAADASHGPCELDRRTIELLVDAPVRQVSRIIDGQPACEYIVSASDGGTDA